MKKHAISEREKEMAGKVLDLLKQNNLFIAVDDEKKAAVFIAVAQQVLLFYRQCEKFSTPTQSSFESVVYGALDVALIEPLDLWGRSKEMRRVIFEERNFSHSYTNNLPNE